MKFLAALLLLSCVAAAQVATQPGATTQTGTLGPDTVMLGELADLYAPVPFDHKSHAEMAEMWEGCTTCHHRPPDPEAADVPEMARHEQAESTTIPACKSCHPKAPDRADIRLPSLKGAYHRQCLNCHRDWAGENSCTICHEPRNGHVADHTATPGDIIGRMHPPIPEPEFKEYQARFTPAMGGKVLFRHKEHSTTYGLKCVNCHHQESCSTCHTSMADASGPKILVPGRTWEEAHGPCVSCHVKDRCNTCHYADGAEPPSPFQHVSTGQELDDDHRDLKCGQCHNILKAKRDIGCGDSSCHKGKELIAFPQHRPGPVVTTQPVAPPSTRPGILLVEGPTGTIRKVRRAR